MRSHVDRRPVASFLVITFALSWTVWIAGAFAAPRLAPVAMALGAFGPAVGAVVVRHTRGDSVRGWLRDALRPAAPRWYLLALGAPVALAAARTVVLAAAGAPVEPALAVGRLPAYLLGTAVVALVGGGQEEFGWRGFLHPALRDRGFLPAAVGTGAAWAVWHLPLFALPGGLYADQPFLSYVPVVCALSVLVGWCHERSGGALSVAVLLHAGVNAAGALVPVPAGSIPAVGSAGHAADLVAVLAVLGVLLVASSGPRAPGAAPA